MTTELVPAEVQELDLLGRQPKELVEKASEMADVLQGVIEDKHLYAVISRKKYVTVEGWTTLGAMVGVFPFIEWTKELPEGWEARCLVRKLDGAVMGAAEAQCTRSEKVWAPREDYALRSMAQTRAVSKAMRVPLSWIMTLAGYEATPAEEMPRDPEQQVSSPRAARPAPPKGQPAGSTQALYQALVKNYHRADNENAADWAEIRAYLERSGAKEALEGRGLSLNAIPEEKQNALIKELSAMAGAEPAP